MLLTVTNVSLKKVSLLDIPSTDSESLGLAKIATKQPAHENQVASTAYAVVYRHRNDEDNIKRRCGKLSGNDSKASTNFHVLEVLAIKFHGDAQRFADAA